MLFQYPVFAVKCDLINPIACGLYDCGGRSWSPDENIGYGDNLSLRSGQVNMIGTSKLCMNVHGPTLIKFMWKVDSAVENAWTLSFWVDNSQVKVCKSDNWTPVTYSLRGDVDHKISWQFLKMNSSLVGIGAGWIDDLDVSNGVPHFEESVCQINKSYSNQTIGIVEPPIVAENASTKGITSNNGMSEFEKPVSQINNSYSNQTIGLVAPYSTDNASGRIKNSNERVITSSGISISSSNVTITVPNISINVAQLSDVTLNISEIVSRLAQPNNVSSMAPTKPKDIVVGKCNCSLFNKSIRCDSINDAIEKAEPGGTVFICGGNYSGPIKITKRITIQGDNNLSTKIKGTGQIISVLSDNVSIRNISVVGDNNRGTIGVYARNAPHFKLIYSNILNCSVGAKILDSADVYIGWTNITRGNTSDTCGCSNENNRSINNYNIGIYLENADRANIAEHNNISIYGSPKDGLNVGILWRHTNQVNNESYCRKIYSDSQINGTTSCCRFLDFESRRCAGNGGIGVF